MGLEITFRDLRAWDSGRAPRTDNTIAIIERHDGLKPIRAQRCKQFEFDYIVGAMIAFLPHVERAVPSNVLFEPRFSRDAAFVATPGNKDDLRFIAKRFA